MRFYPALVAAGSVVAIVVSTFVPFVDRGTVNISRQYTGLEPGGQFLTYDPENRSAVVFDLAAASSRGEALFKKDWSQDLEPVLGPRYDATTCSSCHLETAAQPHQRRTNATIVVAKPTRQIDFRRFGAQLNTKALHGDKPEIRLNIEYETTVFQYPDGETVELRKPTASATDIYGDSIPVNLRVAPLLFGWGLLEHVDPEMVAHYVDPDDWNGDGISGRAAMHDNELAFLGWKNSHSDLRNQIATALANDMGIISAETCGSVECATEISKQDMTALTNYVRRIGVPDRRHLSEIDGQHLFGVTGCSRCHVPVLMTVKDAPLWAAHQLLWPYSDLLLHDMGEDLADDGNDPDLREWRTAPLWGLGLVKQHWPERGLLHDGRARSIEEAILWHGGEAESARDAFSKLNSAQRQQLIDYVTVL